MPKPKDEKKQVDYYAELAAMLASAGQLDISRTADGVVTVGLHDWKGDILLSGEGDTTEAAFADMAEGLWDGVAAWMAAKG